MIPKIHTWSASGLHDLNFLKHKAYHYQVKLEELQVINDSNELELKKIEVDLHKKTVAYEQLRIAYDKIVLEKNTLLDFIDTQNLEKQYLKAMFEKIWKKGKIPFSNWQSS